MNSEKTNCETCEMLIANAATDAERYLTEKRFLQDQIKVLIVAIRSAPDLESLRAVANDTVERLRNRSLEMERARIQAKRCVVLFLFRGVSPMMEFLIFAASSTHSGRFHGEAGAHFAMTQPLILLPPEALQLGRG